MKDFFVSYNRADKQWAEWIAWTLEEAGYSVVIQAWDFRPGGNFVLDMQRAAAESQKTIAVLSESYLKSSYTQPEWAAAFADDPESLKRKLIPVRVKECKPEGMLRPIVYVDLVGVSEADAKYALLSSLELRVKPEQKPGFPGTEVPKVITASGQVVAESKAFPSALSRVQKIKEKSLQQRLDNLTADYEVLAKQRDYTTNAADRNNLERQLEAIAEDMDKVARELDALGVCVSERYRIRLKKAELEGLEDRFDKFEKDYQDVSEQRNYSNNAQEINNLERQLEGILEDLEKLALERDQLQDEIQKLELEEQNTAIPETLKKLVDLLKPINPEIIAKIYRSCLSLGRPRLVPDTLAALVQQLAEIPGEPNEPEPLLHFVSLLIQEPSLDDGQRESLKTWAKPQGLCIQEESIEQQERAEICLMVKVRPRSLNDPSPGYLVSAALAKDLDPFKLEAELDAKPITISLTPDPKCAPGYSQDDLPRILDELVATCGNEYGIALTELVIQWFLPIELMSLPVEHWQFQIGRRQKECSGKRCKAVIVRSSDRHFSPLYKPATGDWKKYWTRLLSIQESKCSAALVPLDPSTGRTKINWRDTKVVGCRFVEHHDPQQREALWDELLGQGTPIVLWMRQSENTSKMQLLSCTIANLSESLASHRQKALSHASEIDRLKAASLCLLIDNPFRPFPTIDYQSA